MTISAPQGGAAGLWLLAGRAGGDAAVPDRGGATADGGFAALLREPAIETGRAAIRLEDYLPGLAATERGFAVETRRQTYSVMGTIGEDAVAFEARPMVAPSAEEAAAAPVGPDPDESGTTGVPGLAADHGSADSAAIRQFQRPDAPAVRDPAGIGGRAVPLREVVEGHARPRPQPVVAQGALASGADALPQARAQRQPTRAAAPAAPIGRGLQTGGEPTRAALARAQLFAQIVAASGEYRVAVRGTRLDPGESERLAEQIRAALRAHGLPDLPVTVSAQGRSA